MSGGEDEEEEGSCEQQTVRHQCQAFVSVEGRRGGFWGRRGGMHVVFFFLPPPSVWCVRGRGLADREFWQRVLKRHTVLEVLGEALLLRFGC